MIENDINGVKFKTSRIISDILSPTICKIHLTDPTFNTFSIKTQTKGDFSQILDLLNFKPKNISFDDLPFIIEIIEILSNESFNINDLSDPTNITFDNVFELLSQHEKYKFFFKSKIDKEIDFISSNFYKICENKFDKFENLHLETIYEIVTNEKLHINDEDQLLNFINKLYSKNVKYSILYESVYFINISSKLMNDFIEIFDLNEITNSIWIQLCNRIKQEIKINKEKNDLNKKRYKKSDLKFLINDKNSFSGIINYLNNKSNGKIENEIDITSSSLKHPNDERYKPKVVTLFNDNDKFFWSENQENNWLCFDFNHYKIIPTHYTIKSIKNNNDRHPKSWVIEGSNDKISWVPLDVQNDCSLINGYCITHTFDIKNDDEKEFKYIRMRQTGVNWYNDNVLVIGAFEFYGTLINE